MTKKIDLKKLLETKTAGIQPTEQAVKAVDAANTSKKIPKNLMFDAEATEFKPETKPVQSMTVRSLTVDEAKDRNAEMDRFVDEVLISGIDYGLVPHTSKPTLLKPGAEKILGFLGLVARTAVVDRVEDIVNGYFAYECKVYVLDHDGIVRAEGVGLANSKEGRYAKNSGFAVQNIILKMAKKRALVDSVLNVGSLSGRFTQDLDDLSINYEDQNAEKTEDKSRSFGTDSKAGYRNQGRKTASPKQIQLLESLMKKHNSAVSAMNDYCRSHYSVDDYHQISPKQCSELIDKYMALG